MNGKPRHTSPYPNMSNSPYLKRTRRAPRRKHKVLTLALLILAIAVLAASAPVLIGRLSAHNGTDPGNSFADLLAREESARSTPASEWRQGTVPYLYQIDPQWADEPYAGGDIRENGCGPTCLAMVYVALTGNTDYTPVEMARFSEQNGFVSDGLTAWTLMTDGAAMLGITGTEISADPDQVRSTLESGQLVICSVRPGDFTTTGHFIVLAGLAENGEVIVHDPNSAERSEHTWDLDRVLDQCANLWSFSA